MKKANHFLQWLIVKPLIGFCLFSSKTFAQDLLVTTDSIYSNVLHEWRSIQIVLPDGYQASSSAKYDVLYVLDGEWDTRKVAWITNYATRERLIPANIIVGIPNRYLHGTNQRQRDFTPTHRDKPSNSGKADQFLTFLKMELMPYINKKYSTNPAYTTVWGSSSGGLLGMYALLSQPSLFQAYILSDPALWWDDEYLADYVRDKLDTLASKNKSLYIGGRLGEAFRSMGISTMETMLSRKAPASLHWKCMAYSDETHSSVIFKTAYDGLKWIYSGYSGKDIVFHPMNGIILKDKPFALWSRIDVPMIRYTTNGTDPTDQSAQLQTVNTIVNPSKLVIKEHCRRDQHDKVAVGLFTTSRPLTPVKPLKKLKAGGFHYRYYEGEWDNLPDLAQLKALRSGIIDSTFDINKLPASGGFALVVEGFLRIPREGYYILALDKDTDQGDSYQYTKLCLSKQTIFAYDCLKGSCQKQSFIVPLQEGYYPFHVEYLYKAGVRNLQFVYIQSTNNNSYPIPFGYRFAYATD